jgi:hypothetical protein
MPNLSELGVRTRTIVEILWHSTGRNITRHYSAAQVRELHAALERIRNEPPEGANKTLRTLAEEAREARKAPGSRGQLPPNSTQIFGEEIGLRSKLLSP